MLASWQEAAHCKFSEEAVSFVPKLEGLMLVFGLLSLSLFDCSETVVQEAEEAS